MKARVSLRKISRFADRWCTKTGSQHRSAITLALTISVAGISHLGRNDRVPLLVATVLGRTADATAGARAHHGRAHAAPTAHQEGIAFDRSQKYEVSRNTTSTVLGLNITMGANGVDFCVRQGQPSVDYYHHLLLVII